MTIKKTDLIRDVIRAHPGTAGVLAASGMGCIGCALARLESIEQGAKAHGFSDEDVDRLVKQLNEAVQKNSAPQKK